MTQKLKILHLEDMPCDAELIKLELNNANIEFESLMVDTREEFIDGLKNFLPDIILADHSLPAFNSREALKIVNDKHINIPFLLVTANISEEMVSNILKEGANCYILKDKLDGLPEAIKQAIRKNNLSKQENAATDIADEKLYDLTLLEEMDDIDYLAEIISIFLDETPKELNEMIKALKSKKVGVVCGKAHKLKSSAGLIEANGFLKLLEQIEVLSKSQQITTELEVLVENAESEYKKIESHLQKHLSNLQQHIH